MITRKIYYSGLTLALMLAANFAKAATTYFDVNGATTNSGIAASGTYSWEGSFWSTSSVGTAATTAWTEGNFPEFAAGGSTTAVNYTVTLGTTHTNAGLLQRNNTGTTTFTGSPMSLPTGQQGYLVSGNVVLSNSVTGPGGIVPECSGTCGSLYLYGSNSFSGGFYMGGANITYVGNSNALGSGNIFFNGVTYGAFGNDGVLDFLGNYTIPNGVNMGSGWYTGTTVAIQEQFIFNDTAAHNMTFGGDWVTGTTQPVLLQFGNQGSNQTFTVAGNISGATGFTNYGSGNLILKGSNSFVGTLVLSNTTTVTTVGGAGTLASALKIVDNGTFIYASSAAQTLSGVISGTGTVTEGGPGALILSGANTYTGTTLLNGGTLQLGHSESAGTSGPIGKSAAANPGSIVFGGGTLQYSSANKVDYSGRFSTTANQTYNIDVNGQSVTYATALTSVGGILSLSDSAGGGILALTGANTYTGGTVINSGTISLNGSVVTPFGGAAGGVNLAGGNIAVSADRGTGANTILNPLTVSANSQIQSAGTTGTRNLVFGGVISGTTNATLTFHENGTSAGPALFNIRFTNTFTMASPITFLSDSNTHTINLDIWNRSDFGDQTYSGLISGTGSLKRSVTTANTGGRAIFTATNTYSGGTLLNDGELALGSDSVGIPNAPVSGPLGIGSITISNDAGKISAYGTARTLYNSFIFGAGHLTLTGTNGLTLAGNMDLGGFNVTFTNNNLGNSALTGVISDGSFTKQGTNSLTLSGTNTLTGAVTVANGTLVIDATGSISNTSGITIAGGATLDVSAQSTFALGSATFTGTSTTNSSATIIGGTLVDFGSSPITLNFNSLNPALVVAAGSLNLNGNAFTINGPQLAPGTYTLIQQTTGSIASSGILTVTGGTALSGETASIVLSGGTASLVVNATPVFSNLIGSPTTTYGASSVLLSGTIGAGTNYPAAGETITVKIGTNIQTTTISDSTGDFSIAFVATNLPYAATNYPITYTYGGDSSLSPAVDTTTALTVGKATLTVTANSTSSTYGSAIPVLTASYANFVNGDTVAVLSGSPALTTAATSASTVASGPYTITAGVGTLSAANYTFAFVNGSLAITPAPLTVSAANVSIPYGATNPIFTATYTNFVNGETLGTSDVTGAPIITTTATTNSPVGLYDLVISNGTLASTNYSFVLLNGALVITNAVSTNVITASTNPALPGTEVVFTASLSTLAPSLAVPAGTVQFLIDGLTNGTPVTLTNGQAMITNSTLSHGTHTLEADFAGDTNIIGSTNILSELIDTPPTAGLATFSRPRDAGLHIRITDLLTNATDVDGDAISFVSVSSTSTNGAAVATNGIYVNYVPPATNGNVTDTFTYTVADSYGLTNSGTVMITILPDDNGPSVNITGLMTLPDGTVQINFAGIPNRNYLIQAATNLTTPITWTTLTNEAAGTNGLFNYIDPNATNYPARFYRTATP